VLLHTLSTLTKRNSVFGVQTLVIHDFAVSCLPPASCRDSITNGAATVLEIYFRRDGGVRLGRQSIRPGGG
jgi:hypothetical protein